MTPRALALAALPLLAAPLAAQEVAMPSGLPARLYDVVLEPADGGAPLSPDAFTDPEAEEGEAALADLGDEPLGAAVGADPLGEELAAPSGGRARFRLVVEGLGGEGADYDTVAGDFAWLCEHLAVPALAANAWSPTEVTVVLSDRETTFGALDPEAVQFFAGFRIADGACVPQAF